MTEAGISYRGKSGGGCSKNSGRYGLVSVESAGPAPDYVLMSDLQAFQGELGTNAETGEEEARVVVRESMTLVREADAQIVANRRFDHTALAESSETEALIAAFDVAMREMLGEAVDWAGGLLALAQIGVDGLVESFAARWVKD